jgi:hypothetical protein
MKASEKAYLGIARRGVKKLAVIPTAIENQEKAVTG